MRPGYYKRIVRTEDGFQFHFRLEKDMLEAVPACDIINYPLYDGLILFKVVVFHKSIEIVNVHQ